MTKIALPIKDGVLSNHFGHPDHFYIYELGDSGIPTQGILIPPPHQPGLLPQWLATKGITDIIANGIGQRAISLFYQYKINVFTGVPIKPPKELVTDFVLGILETSDNACDH